MALEMSQLVEQHYILWRGFENLPRPFQAIPGCTVVKRQIAFSHEIIYKAGVLWQRLLDLLYLQGKVNGNLFDSNVPGEMCLSYERAYQMRELLANPPALAEDAVPKKRDMEVLVAHLLEQAKINKFRKRGSIVMSEKVIAWDGGRYATHAWVPAEFNTNGGDNSLESFVYYFCRRELFPEMHLALVRCLPIPPLWDFEISSASNRGGEEGGRLSAALRGERVPLRAAAAQPASLQEWDPQHFRAGPRRVAGL